MIELICPIHGTQSHSERIGRKPTCNKCRAEAVTRRRREIKSILVKEAGGRCVECGYDKCIAALSFHHRDPTQKDFGLSNVSWSIERCREEAEKCDLLCANCHMEAHHEVAGSNPAGDTN